jgi:hypothetical protein
MDRWFRPTSHRAGTGSLILGSPPLFRILAYSSKAHSGLDLYTPQDRFDAYNVLGLKATAYPDGNMELTAGPLCSDLESRRLSP